MIGSGFPTCLRPPRSCVAQQLTDVWALSRPQALAVDLGHSELGRRRGLTNRRTLLGAYDTRACRAVCHRLDAIKRADDCRPAGARDELARCLDFRSH
jgi:hypothetical protein